MDLGISVHGFLVPLPLGGEETYHGPDKKENGRGGSGSHDAHIPFKGPSQMT